MSDGKAKLIRFHCPHCNVVMKGRVSDGGEKRKCPSCAQTFRIPRPNVTEQEQPPKKEQELVPVVCGICSTRMYATVDQIGNSMECPDCFTQTLVKAPPKRAKPSAPRMDVGFGYDVEPPQERTAVKSLGEELLEEADQFVERKLEEEPKVPDRPFLSGVFLFPFYGRIFPVVLGMAVGWALVLGLVKFTWELQGHASLLAPFLIVGTAIALLLVTFPTLVSLQKIFENTSNGDEDTDCRPEGGLLAFIDWIGDVIPLLVAFFVSCIPGMMVMKGFGLRPEYYFGVAFSAFIIFPIIFLSMLESASIAGIYSKAVWTSFRKIPGPWFKFYSLSSMLFLLCLASVGAIAYLANRELDGPTIAGGIAALAGILICLTIYFRLLGRLTFLMSQKILVEVFFEDDQEADHLDENAESRVSMGV